MILQHEMCIVHESVLLYSPSGMFSITSAFIIGWKNLGGLSLMSFISISNASSLSIGLPEFLSKMSNLICGLRDSSKLILQFCETQHDNAFFALLAHMK